jgi:hypothetical protein
MRVHRFKEKISSFLIFFYNIHMQNPRLSRRRFRSVQNAAHTPGLQPLPDTKKSNTRGRFACASEHNERKAPLSFGFAACINRIVLVFTLMPPLFLF